MKKTLLSLFIITFLISCSGDKNTNYEPHNSTKKVVYPSDNPAERVIWEQIRFKDPETGKIPEDMRRKEMTFAKTLPVSTKLTKSNWIHRGPYNVGGRTRAISFDILDENVVPCT